MLYHYASLDYLKGLHYLVGQLLDGVVDPLLNLAKQQRRDSALFNSRWGSRDTSGNWSNNAWPILKDLQKSLSKNIAIRSFDRYGITGVSECLRGVDQFSMQWATELEEQQYQEFTQLISGYARRIDDTLEDRDNSRWDDYGFAYDFGSFIAECPRIPEFRIREDIVGETGKVPPRTGVYVSQDDSNAALQFAWAGSSGCRLRNSTTFNKVGLAALAMAGRRDLWLDQDKMFRFATTSLYASLFHTDLVFGNEVFKDLAPSAVARKAFIDRPCKWQFVEIISDDFEDSAIIWNGGSAVASSVRLTGGDVCSIAGFYFSPSSLTSHRYFEKGDIMPKFDSGYGMTIWQWDTNQ